MRDTCSLREGRNVPFEELGIELKVCVWLREHDGEVVPISQFFVI